MIIKVATVYSMFKTTDTHNWSTFVQKPVILFLFWLKKIKWELERLFTHKIISIMSVRHVFSFTNFSNHHFNNQNQKQNIWIYSEEITKPYEL